ncbi:MAG: patatin-like phospholipase family protein [Rhizonema sp. NSF051]|nr:patatin-like phospholipase family protein [Rhizonema sp. NSF051]
MYTNGKEGKNPRETYRILSLDGGGIRGLITAVWLDRLEKELGKPIKDHFNLIAGTSTGSILACGISLGIPASQLVNIYKHRGEEIFPQLDSLRRTIKFIKHLPTQGLDQQLYCDQGLKKVLQEEFQRAKIPEKYISKISPPENENAKGGDLFFKDIRYLNGNELTTLVTSYDTLNRKAVIFDSREDNYNEIPMWEICKASSSAPMFFPAHIMEMKNGNAEPYTIPLIDGGVIASNPTACAIAEGMKATKNLKLTIEDFVPIEDFVVVSLGTGDSNRSISIKQAKNWGIYKWSYHITNVLFDGVSQAMDHIATSMLPRETYFRFQAKLEKDSLDDVSPENLNALQAFANCYFDTYDYQDKIKELKKILKDTHKVKVCNHKKIVNNCSCENSSRNGHNHKVESTPLLQS